MATRNSETGGRVAQERVVEKFSDAGKITAEVIDAVRARLGVERELVRGYHTEVTRDNIRHFVDGIGDDNPLWSVEAYAAESVWGQIITPPAFWLSCQQGPRHRGAPEKSTGGGMPGIHGVWVEEEWEWFTVGLLGERVKVLQTFIHDMNVRESGFGGTVLETVSQDKLYSGDRLVARHRDRFIRHDRKQASEKNKYGGFRKYEWSEAELRELSDAIEAEERRGAIPRYWEDVRVGDIVPPIHKGPLTGTEMTTWVQGWGGPFMMASRILHRYIRRHPALNIPDRYTNAPDVPERAHWDEEYAQETGFPSGYDFGGQRFSWMTHAVTDWMGDAGFLSKVRSRFRRLNLLGDLQRISGVVTDKRLDGEHGIVEIELQAVNQRDEVTTHAWATVILPREGSTLPAVGIEGLDLPPDLR